MESSFEILLLAVMIIKYMGNFTNLQIRGLSDAEGIIILMVIMLSALGQIVLILIECILILKKKCKIRRL
jgi:hypothetical protein